MPRTNAKPESCPQSGAVNPKRLATCIVLALTVTFSSSAPFNPNRPTAQPPKVGLHFSAAPAPVEFFNARVFDEPLVPIGGEPSLAENAALAAALREYAQRGGPDDFSALTSFLERYPRSPWRAALLTGLGLEYYNTAHYSQALEAWSRAWTLAKDAADPAGKAIGDRAAGELAYMYARLGRMTELEALLNSVANRVFVGPATEKISGARAGLANMKERPEIAFRCGSLALHRIKIALEPGNPGNLIIHESASTQKGFSLPQVADLAKKVGLNYQMAFREKGAAFIVPSVVHWKVGHYAAVIRQAGDRFLLQDPTFWNDAWATREALESESSGYFLVPSGALPAGWRQVDANEGAAIWGKGNTCCNDPDPHGCKDQKKSDPCGKKQPCKGMAVANVHLMLVSLNIVDEPVGYLPPVGPAMGFGVTYNQREANQPTIFTYSNLGPKWTFDWLAYIKDNPLSPSADVKYYIMGGGTRTFDKFDPNTQTYANQQFDQAKLTRTSAASYEMLFPDGSRRIFGQSDGSIGTSRKVFLTQLQDPKGNSVSISYDAYFRVVALTDSIGQVTTIDYGNTNDIYKITKVTDPFGRFALFDYDAYGRLTVIRDVIGLTSRFTYEGTSDFINSLITPYGTNTFIRGESGTTRWLETIYPDGERDRVEYNQLQLTPVSVPPSQVPVGMATKNDYLWFRNTYFWSKNAYASAYPDYNKATIFHWLHTADLASTAGILESIKEPLEGRVWFDYGGQTDPIMVGTNNKPAHAGRVLDDGTTQLYTYEYNAFGRVTKSIDPQGRTVTAVYATNGIDLLESRQTRAGNNELLSSTVYNSQHLPLRTTNAAGQVTVYTYNPRGQLLTQTDAKNQTTVYTYNNNGYLISVDGALPGTNDVVTFTHDAFGRVRTARDESGYTLTYDYDALDRPTRTTYPDNTYEEITYVRMDAATYRDRAGRVTTFEYDPLGQAIGQTDPLQRTNRFQWCKCGETRTLTDPLGRTTTWTHDIQGRVTRKEFADGSAISYIYENTTSRLKQVIDERLQITQYSYNRDNSISSISYPNAIVPTSPVGFTYDLNYNRLTGMADGSGKTIYSYYPITVPPALGAGELATIDGPLTNDTITHVYDELGRQVSTAIDGIAVRTQLDAAGRPISVTNALGIFNYSYEGPSFRVTSQSAPNGQVANWVYAGNQQDNTLQRITNTVGATALSHFIYTDDLAAARITSWLQKAGTAQPSIFTFGYDAANQLTSVQVTNAGVLAGSFGYSYDQAGNRLSERIDATTNIASYNTLNQLTALSSGPGAGVTNQWDAEQRLVAVEAGNQRTEFTYDGLGRRVAIRKLVNGLETSLRRFVWCDDDLCEERDGSGAVTKRFFDQGFKVQSGPIAGNYFYTRDHLDSVREVTDGSGTLRARYAYDPFGRRTQVAGDISADFGFAGMFWSSEAGLNLTRYRAYDPALGRWLSRDPMKRAEIIEGPNLYAYVGNDPVNLIDPLGLSPKPLPDFCYGKYDGTPWCETGEPPPPPKPIECSGPDDPWCPKPALPKNPSHCDIQPDDPWCRECTTHPDLWYCKPPPPPPPPPGPPKMPRPKPPKKPPKKPKPSPPKNCIKPRGR
jgi:RHS repeat-associated protein